MLISWKPIHDFLSNFYWHFLSHTVFEIFDFKVLKPWPLPLEVTWGQKYFHYSKAPTWLPTSLPLTLSSYLIPFLRYLTSKFSCFHLDHWRSPEVENILTIWKPIHDFRFWDIRLQVFRVRPWPLEVTQGQNNIHCLEAHTWLPIQLLLILSLYLIPFAWSSIITSIWIILLHMFMYFGPVAMLQKNKSINQSISYRFFRYSTSKFSGFDLDLQRSPDFKVWFGMCMSPVDWNKSVTHFCPSPKIKLSGLSQ